MGIPRMPRSTFLVAVLLGAMLAACAASKEPLPPPQKPAPLYRAVPHPPDTGPRTLSDMLDETIRRKKLIRDLDAIFERSEP